MNVITRIMTTYSDMMKNDREVPPFLQKQMEAVWLSKEDPERGLMLLLDGMRDEMDYLDELINAEPI